MLSSMFIGYSILNKKEKSGMKTVELRVFSLKTEFVVNSFPGHF